MGPMPYHVRKMMEKKAEENLQKAIAWSEITPFSSAEGGAFSTTSALHETRARKRESTTE